MSVSLMWLSFPQPYGRAVDWWCLGAVLYEMLYGLPPFYSRNTSEMYERILNKPLTLRSGTSESARDLLSQVSFMNYNQENLYYETFFYFSLYVT